MTDRRPPYDQNETPEDVATLYSWANLHGAKYRDFSASRAQTREQVRLRVQQALEAEQAAASQALPGQAQPGQAQPGQGQPQTLDSHPFQAELAQPQPIPPQAFPPQAFQAEQSHAAQSGFQPSLADLSPHRPPHGGRPRRRGAAAGRNSAGCRGIKAGRIDRAIYRAQGRRTGRSAGTSKTRRRTGSSTGTGKAGCSTGLDPTGRRASSPAGADTTGRRTGPASGGGTRSPAGIRASCPRSSPAGRGRTAGTRGTMGRAASPGRATTSSGVATGAEFSGSSAGRRARPAVAVRLSGLCACAAARPAASEPPLREDTLRAARRGPRAAVGSGMDSTVDAIPAAGLGATIAAILSAGGGAGAGRASCLAYAGPTGISRATCRAERAGRYAARLARPPGLALVCAARRV